MTTLRRLAPAAIVLAVAVAGGRLLFAGNDPAPWPPEERVISGGFAIWPEDTIAEGRRACEDPPLWRLDAALTALRFASEVLHYPEPYTDDPSPSDDSATLQIGTRGIDELFLGSVLELRRYGRCWFVRSAQPREGEVSGTIAFVHRSGVPHLYLAHPDGVPPGSIGFGSWEMELVGGDRAVTFEVPDDVGDDDPGHAIFLRPDETGLSESVSARPLPPVPAPAPGPALEPLGAADVSPGPGTCRIDYLPNKSPERLIRYLYEWVFDDQLAEVRGRREYERKSWRSLGGDRWRLLVDDAVLDATISELDGRCWTLVSLEPVGRDSPLRWVRAGEGSATFSIDWGGGDDATVAFTAGERGGGGQIKQIREPLTFPYSGTAPGASQPGHALVILYKEGHVVSASYGLYEM